MRALLTSALFLFPLIALSFSAHAVDEHPVIPVHALAMHGEPKYGPDFEYLDYVNPDAPKGGTMRLAAIGTYDSVNPFILKGVPAAITSMTFETLLASTDDEPFTEYGLLAKSISMPDDRAWVTFTLRDEAKWHDGTPVTANDVVWSFNTLRDKGAPFYRAYYANVKDVTAESDKRVKFTFDGTDNRELPLIIGQMPVLPKHYWNTAGHAFDETTLTPILGSGPYKVREVVAGKRIVLERVADWWGKDLPINRGRYNFDTITVDYYRDDTVALEALFAGEYDFRRENTAKTWATAYNANPVIDGDIIKETVEHGNPAGMQAFVMNIRKPVFQDIAVRKAVNEAFDFEWSNKQFAYGAYKRTDSYFENSDLASSGVPEGRELEILEKFRDQLPEDLFNKPFTLPVTNGTGNNRQQLRDAIKLLEDAGYILGPDKIRVNKKTGQRLEFEIVDNNPAFERWANPFIRNLERIGIKATFRILDTAQYQNRINDFDFDMTIGTFPQSMSPGNEQRDFWSSQKADEAGSRNLIGIKNPVVDTLVDMVIKAPNREELVARTRALDRVLLWQYYVVSQWHLNAYRLAYWDKFGQPDISPKYGLGVIDTWWAKDKN